MLKTKYKIMLINNNSQPKYKLLISQNQRNWNQVSKIRVIHIKVLIIMLMINKSIIKRKI